MKDNLGTTEEQCGWPVDLAPPAKPPDDITNRINVAVGPSPDEYGGGGCAGPLLTIIIFLIIIGLETT